MHCDIYKFAKHDGLYVYIARPDYPDDTHELRDWLGVLPSDFRASLGRSEFVMHLDLAHTAKLAQVDRQQVLDKLNTQGYFVQLPPDEVMRRQAELRVKAAQDALRD